jgi:hypothetical protein
MYDILNKFQDLEKEEAKVSSFNNSAIHGQDDITSFVTDDDNIDLMLYPVSVSGIVRDAKPATTSVYTKYEDMGNVSGGYSFNKFEQHDELQEMFQNRNPLLETKIDFDDF